MLGTAKVITIGRVGALAIALGIGGAIAAAPAWADSSEPASSTGRPAAATHRADRGAATG